MQDIERGETRQRKLELLLDVLAEAKELKPGAVNRHVLVALVRIHPWLTPEMVAQPRIEPLAQRIGLTAHVIKTTRQTMGNHRGNEQAAFSKAFNGAPSGSPEDNIIRAMAILKQLATLLEYTKPDPLNVASLLLGYSQPNLQSVLIEAEELRASRLGQKAAVAKHAHDRERRGRVRKMWASGEFKTKEACAAEAERLGLGKFQTLRNALKNAPRPDPWPARQEKAKTKPGNF